MNKHFTPGLIASLLFCNLLALTLAPGLNADVTGRRTRVDDSASCVGNQPDARVIGRHRTTRNAPITHLLLTQLLTHQNASRCRVYSSRRPARLPDTESVYAMALGPCRRWPTKSDSNVMSARGGGRPPAGQGAGSAGRQCLDW